MSTTVLAFAVGMGIGIVLATICLVFAAIYDDYCERRRRK
jgi:hypothetical protein